MLALSETARAQALIATGDSKGEAPGVLDYAASELAQAAPKIAKCTDAQGAARRKYKF